MDAAKRQKTSSSSKLDAISEDIVTKIISLLPLKDAMRTSILAKPWKDRWKDITKLEVKEQEFRNRPRFRNFMDKLLTVCNSPMRKFSLKCDVHNDTPKVNQWLTGFITPAVQDLKLRFDKVNEQLVLPTHIFTSKSLTHLCLRMSHVINLPSSIHFPNLKTLTLKHVVFPDTPRTQQLFSGCPSLEELQLIDCVWLNVQQVRIVCPLLQSLIIRDWGDFSHHAPLHDVDPLHYCQIYIFESFNLKKFSYDGDLLNGYFLTSTSVTDVSLELQEPSLNSILHPGRFVFNFLMILSNVEKLSISCYVVETLNKSPQIIAVLPWFANLTELSVGHPEPVNLGSSAMQTILRHAPNLETLHFTKGVILHKSVEDQIGPIPACFQTNLEFLRIDDFGGTVEEISALRTLVGWAMILDYLYVNVGHQFDSEEGEERLDELWDEILSFPGATRISYITLD